MAGTTLAQGSSVTLTLAASDSILIDSGAGGRARIEAVSGVGGAANQAILAVHPGGQATYGPFGAGTVKLIALGGPISYVSGVAPLVDETSGQRGVVLPGVWFTVPSICRLRLVGTGTATIDAKDSLGNITTDVAEYSAAGATDQIEFPFFGTNAVAIRAAIDSGLSVEVI